MRLPMLCARPGDPLSFNLGNSKTSTAISSVISGSSGVVFDALESSHFPLSSAGLRAPIRALVGSLWNELWDLGLRLPGSELPRLVTSPIRGRLATASPLQKASVKSFPPMLLARRTEQFSRCYGTIFWCLFQWRAATAPPLPPHGIPFPVLQTGILRRCKTLTPACLSCRVQFAGWTSSHDIKIHRLSLG